MIKKSLSIVLAALMTLSCMSAMLFTASAENNAPEGTGISSLSEITDMAGKYYLTADIGSASALSSTQISGSFTGTLDGKDANGNVHTIYTSVPVFAQLGAGATVKNLVIDGAINQTLQAVGESLGALAEDTAIGSDDNKIYLDTVTNNATITVAYNNPNATDAETKFLTGVGGLIGTAQCAIIADDCVNNGSITMTTVVKTGDSVYIGGIVGKIADTCTQTIQSVYTNCKNNAELKATPKFNYLMIGGIIGRNNGNPYKLVSCTNTVNGKITATSVASKGVYLAGMVGYNVNTANCDYINCVNSADMTGSYFIGGISAHDATTGILKNCVNEGDITFDNQNKKSIGGGIMAYPTGSSAIIFENCENRGNMVSSNTNGTCIMGGIVGYSESDSSSYFTFVNCVNLGNFTACDAAAWGGKAGGIFGTQSGSTTVKITFVGCYNGGTIASSSQVGGIAGQLVGVCRLASCVNEGTVTGAGSVQNGGFGGIIGRCDSTTDTKINNCVNKGTVSVEVAKGTIAGIVGIANDVTVISHCENAGTLVREGGTTSAISSTGVQSNCYDRTGDNAVNATVSLDFQGVQRSIAVDGEESFSLRFITKITDIENYLSTGVMIYLTESGKSAVKYTTESTDTVYTQIGANVNGVNKAYPETVIENTYFSALTVTDISVDGTYSFIVIPYTVDLDGNYVCADAYTVTVVDGGQPTCTAIIPTAN